MNKYIMTIFFLLIAAVTSGYASTCVQDLNGDGVIEQNEMWTCLATNPPLCPHGIMNCTITSITLTGAVNAAQTNIQNNMGITSISADAQGASLVIDGWTCNADTCSSANIGSIIIQNATVSGSVSADMISGIVGNGSTLEIYGCDGGTSCAVQLLGTINITGSTITGSASAAAGLTTISASGATLSLSGMTCNGTVCSQVNAGKITVTGSSAVCPAGSQYQCINVSGVQQCSPLPCTDNTFGGEVTPGQQICAKDLNGNGVIEQDEISICQQYNNQYYCPLQAQNCTKQTIQPVCPAGGSLSGSQCVSNVIGNSTCPAGYTLGTGNACAAAPKCAQGTLDTGTMLCVIGYTCPLGSQYGCWPNTADNNVMQCNNIPCADPSAQNPVTTSSNQTSLQNDGAKDSTGQCLGTLYIFNGKPLQCRPAGVNTNFFNCCDQSQGSFLFIKKTCGEPDTDCVAAAAAGSCHFVGSYCMTSWPFFGCVQNANVYCCFSDMLARIIQEQGRSQLNSFPDGFGSTGSPDCRGFTTDEFSHIDFSKINFSEYINANEAKMQTNVQSAVNKMQQQSTGTLQKTVQPAQ